MKRRKELKHCPSCNQSKSRLMFHKNSARYDGLQSICKDCRKPKKAASSE